MVDAKMTFESCMEAMSSALASGDRAAAEQALRSAIKATEGQEGLELNLLSALTKLGALKQEMGNSEEAESLLARALVISETHLGEQHQDLVILLNDLSRLYLKRSAHALAEPLLMRLLAIKRSKGDDHPEVATVLASLAAVRQALGLHEAAEQLWRRVLGIREQTLAPNHFSLATTLENLAETCAARGKLKEALQLLQRAQAIRELTLGPDHASLRVARERIADLRLQYSEESIDASGGVPLPSERPRLSSGEQFGITLAKTSPREKVLLPASEVAVLNERVTLTPPPFPTPASVAKTDGAPYLNVLMDIKDEMEDTVERRALVDRISFASVLAFLRERRAAVIVGVGALTLPLLALGVASAARTSQTSWVEQPNVARSSRESLSVAAPAFPEISARAQAPANDPLRDMNASESKRAVERREEVPNISLPSGPRPSVSRLDSVVKSINLPRGAVAEVTPFQLTSILDSAKKETVLNVGPAGAPVRARVIGAVPTPRYPDQRNRRVTPGDVRVRFDVDTDGRPVMSTFNVVVSPDSLLTAAVRDVVSELHFEPARTPWPESKPIVDRVELGFKFAAARVR